MNPSPLYEEKQALRHQFEEQAVIFFSILKWVILATVAGAIVGAASFLFIELLEWATGRAVQLSGYFFLAIPFVFLFNTWAIRKFAPDAAGHGTEKVIEAVHKKNGKINPSVIPIKLFTTILTLASGGSVGKEGPCAQIGAGLTSFGAQLVGLKPRDRRKLVICGISAGFAAVFGTPISGAFFGVEVLFVGGIMYEVMLPSFIAGITAYQVSSALGMHHFHSSIIFGTSFSESFFVKIILAGVFFGIVSSLLVESVRFTEKRAKAWKAPAWAKNLIGGSVLVGLVFLLGKDYLGLGMGQVTQALRGDELVWYAFLAKLLFTVLTLSFGGSGGILTPIFFIGATAGSALAYATGMDPATFAALGMVAVLAGAANTPIAASIMGVELFGPELGPYAAVACVISFLMTGHRSVYPSQILQVSKSDSLEIELGKDMDSQDTAVPHEQRYRLYGWLRMTNRLKRLLGRQVAHWKEKSAENEPKG
jgi:H+/Cl- antiporter ClcA